VDSGYGVSFYKKNNIAVSSEMQCCIVVIFSTVASRFEIRFWGRAFCLFFPALFDLEDGESIFSKTYANYATSSDVPEGKYC
jgi:hypothetical protein